MNRICIVLSFRMHCRTSNAVLFLIFVYFHLFWFILIDSQSLRYIAAGWFSSHSTHACSFCIHHIDFSFLLSVKQLKYIHSFIIICTKFNSNFLHIPISLQSIDWLKLTSMSLQLESSYYFHHGNERNATFM